MAELTSWTEVWLVKVESLIGEEVTSQELEVQPEFFDILSGVDVDVVHLTGHSVEHSGIASLSLTMTIS